MKIFWDYYLLLSTKVFSFITASYFYLAFLLKRSEGSPPHFILQQAYEESYMGGTILDGAEPRCNVVVSALRH